MSSAKGVKRNVVLNVLRMSINMAFSLLTFPYVSKHLGPTNLGKVDFSISLVSYFILFSSLGIPSYGVIVCAKCRDNKDKLKKTLCELLYINSVFVVIAYILFYLMLFNVHSISEYRLLLCINSVSIAFTTMGIEWFYNAIEDFEYITVRSLIFKVISFLAIVLMIHSPKDYVIYAIIMVFSSVGSNFLNIIHARNYIHLYKLSELNINRHIIPIIAFFSATLAASINSSLDTTMLGFIKSDYDVGIYSFSVKIKNVLTSVITAALAAMVPRLSFLAGQKAIDLYKSLLRRLLIWSITFATGMSLFCTIMKEQIIYVLGGKEFLNSSICIVILSVSVIVISFSWTLGVGVLQVMGGEKKYTKVIFISALVNCFLNVLFIPNYGVEGAAMATLITEIISSFIMYIYSSEYITDCLNDLHLSGIFFATVLSGITGVYLRGILEDMGSMKQLLVFALFFFLEYLGLCIVLNEEIRIDCKVVIETILRKMKNG